MIMGIILSDKEIDKRLEEKLKNQNIDWFIKEYKGLCKTEVFCTCKSCGQKYLKTALQIDNGCFVCVECSNLSREYDTKRVKKLLDEKLKDKNIKYFDFEYNRKESTHQKIRCKCMVEGCGHEWDVKINSVLSRNTGCIKCYERGRITTKEDVIRFLNIMNSKEKYFSFNEDFDYKGDKTKIEITFLETNKQIFLT